MEAGKANTSTVDGKKVDLKDILSQIQVTWNVNARKTFAGLAMWLSGRTLA
jgi:hypothetical protein